MILFLGDSFTWGQGLEWYYYTENNILTIDQINYLIPPKHACERLGFDASEYRKKHRWPALVSKHYDICYDLGKVGNGGGNFDFYYILDNIHHLMYVENLSFIVVQFTHVGRSSPNFVGNPDELIHTDVNKILESLEKIKYLYNVDWVTLSWMPETADFVSSLFPNKSVIFEYDNKKYNSFEPFLNEISIHQDIGENDNRIRDYHFSKKGHEIIANSVISHIDRNYLMFKKNIPKKII